MRNRYPGNCVSCGKHVPAGEGYFERVNARENPLHALAEGVRHKWVVRCMVCVRVGKPAERLRATFTKDETWPVFAGE